MVEVELAVPSIEFDINEWVVIVRICNQILEKLWEERILRLENRKKGCIILLCDFSGRPDEENRW